MSKADFAGAIGVNAGEGSRLKFSFCTLVTQEEQYQGMLASARQAGFTEDCEFLYADNRGGNRYDAFSALRRFNALSQAEYLIYCHQDVVFEFDGRRELEACLQELTERDAHWAVAGNAGKTFAGEKRVRITDPAFENLSHGPFPARVMSLDENFIVLRRDAGVTTRTGVSGFHLYGADLCQSAQYLGWHAYVIDFHLRHLSSGKLDASYHQLERQLRAQYARVKHAQVVQAMCSRFYVGANPWVGWLFNRPWLLALHKSLKKKLRRDATW